jgi:hypothetical protein
MIIFPEKRSKRAQVHFTVNRRAERTRPGRIVDGSGGRVCVTDTV